MVPLQDPGWNPAQHGMIHGEREDADGVRQERSLLGHSKSVKLGILNAQILGGSRNRFPSVCRQSTFRFVSFKNLYCLSK